ncbi:MAG: hypothetical protein AAF614_17565 [Chloroflexota bacterium]
MTKTVTKRVQGELWQKNGQSVLRLQEQSPEKTADNLLFLRFAFVLRSTRAHVFPSFLLDDWGAEVRSLKLYRWVREFGEQFPRAEVFGVTQGGGEIQFFLRDIELYAKLPCYAYPDLTTHVFEGALLAGVLLPTEGLAEPQQLKRPLAIKRPLRSTNVQWWQIPTAAAAFDFSLLKRQEDDY